MQTLASQTSNGLIPLLWRSAPGSTSILHWALSKLPEIFPTPTPWLCQTDLSDWSRSRMICRLVYWCVSPSFARQAILQALASWVESPTDSGHIFIVPRILQRDFGRLSKFVHFGGQYNDLPLPFTPLVPFLIYFIPPFNRHSTYQHQLTSTVDTVTNPVPSWIQTELNGLIRLSAPS